jgi:DNA-binding beta-propeller fold protein YncE
VVTPDGKTLWVTLFSKNEIVPITAATGAIGKDIAVGDGPDAIAINAAGTEAVVANNGAGTASLVDLSTDKMTGTVTVGVHPDAVAITSSGPNSAEFAFVANYTSASVTSINLSSGNAQGTVDVPAGPDALVAAPNGDSVLVASRLGNKVSKVEVWNLSIRHQVTIPSPTGIIVSAQSDVAYVVSGSGTLVQMTIHGFTVTPTGSAGSAPLALVLVPSGRFVLVADSGSGKIAEIDVTTGKTILAITSGAGVDSVALTGAGPV